MAQAVRDELLLIGRQVLVLEKYHTPAGDYNSQVTDQFVCLFVMHQIAELERWIRASQSRRELIELVQAIEQPRNSKRFLGCNG